MASIWDLQTVGCFMTLQGEGNHELKVALLQVSFARKIFKCVGIDLYLKLLHPVILSTLQQSEDIGLGVAASTLLIESCEELGVPITCSQVLKAHCNYALSRNVLVVCQILGNLNIRSSCFI